jgi:hypothetical protein
MILRVFHDVDLRNNHVGLTRYVAKYNIVTGTMPVGEHLVFINTKRDKVKIFSGGGLLSYYMAPHGRLNLNVIQELPSYFDGGTFNWKKAELLALDKLLAKKGK